MFLLRMSATNGSQILLWIGIILNMVASIIQVYEKINNDQMKKIMIDIQSIKNGTYVDESSLIDIPQQPLTNQQLFSQNQQYQDEEVAPPVQPE